MKKPVFLGILVAGILLALVISSFAETNNIALVKAVRDYINYGSNSEQLSQHINRASWDEIVEVWKLLDEELFPQIRIESRDSALEAADVIFEQLSKGKQCFSALEPPLGKFYQEWRERKEQEARIILVSNLLRERVRNIASFGGQKKEE